MTFGFALCALAVAAGSTVETRQDTDTRSIRDGVFSAEQVTRGEEVFGQVCSSCHTPRDYTGANFMSLWSGASVFEFFDFLSFTMPEDQPGALSQQQYVDVITYIFSLNDLPTGEAEMPTDEDALTAITIEVAEP